MNIVRYFVFGLITSSCFAQSDIGPNANNWPTLNLTQEGDFEWDGFPAISKDSKSILLIRNAYSCCIGTASELILMDTRNSRVLNKLLLSRNETETQFNFSEKKSILSKAQEIINSNSFSSLKAAELSIVKTDSLTVNWKGQKLKINKFALPFYSTSSFCCTGLIGGKPCKILPNASQGWISEEKKYVLIEYGVTHGANGCDIGPDYRIIHLN